MGAVLSMGTDVATMAPLSSDSHYEGRVMSVDLPVDVWAKVVGFELRGGSCLRRLSAVNSLLRDASGGLLGWEGASACIVPQDLEFCRGRHRFEDLVSKWRYCKDLFVNFQDSHFGKGRLLLGSACSC